jgi:hypothetical protein
MEYSTAGGDAVRGEGVGGEVVLVVGDIAGGSSACDCFGVVGEEAALIVVGDLEWRWKHQLGEALINARCSSGHVPCELSNVLREALPNVLADHMCELLELLEQQFSGRFHSVRVQIWG